MQSKYNFRHFIYLINRWLYLHDINPIQLNISCEFFTSDHKLSLAGILKMGIEFEVKIGKQFGVKYVTLRFQYQSN